MTRKLLVNDGRSERELLLVGNLIVGRDPMCEISGDNSLLSRRHAEFVLRADDVVVRDLGSRNGIFVNGMKVAEGALRDGDVVQIGHLRLQYVEDKAPLSMSLDAAHADAPGTLFAAVAEIRAPSARPVPAPTTPDDNDDTRVVPSPVPSTGHGRSDDDEYTRVVPSPARQTARVVSEDTEYTAFVPSPVPPGQPGAPFDDDDYTRVVAAPLSAPSPPQYPGQTSQTEDADEFTRMVAAPVYAAGVKGATVLTRGLAPEAATDRPLANGIGGDTFARTARLAAGSWTTFVFVQLATLAAVVFVAVLVPFLVRGAEALNGAGVLWLVPSVVVVLIAIYIVGETIARRTIQGLAALSEDVEYAADGTLEAVGDPLGAAAVKSLANSINRVVARLRATADKHDR